MARHHDFETNDDTNDRILGFGNKKQRHMGSQRFPSRGGRDALSSMDQRIVCVLQTCNQVDKKYLSRGSLSGTMIVTASDRERRVKGQDDPKQISYLGCLFSRVGVAGIPEGPCRHWWLDLRRGITLLAGRYSLLCSVLSREDTGQTR